MASREWLNEFYVNEFKKISGVENVHPAIGSLCHAVLHLSQVRPTSLTQQEYLVHAFEWILRSINEITDFKGDFVGVNLKDPRDLLFENAKKDMDYSNVLPFQRGNK